MRAYGVRQVRYIVISFGTDRSVARTAQHGWQDFVIGLSAGVAQSVSFERAFA